MSQTEQLQDAVLLFAADGSAVEVAMCMAEFENLCQGVPESPALVGRQLRAAYVTVAPGFKVEGLVFFTLSPEPDGRLTLGFNVALSYLLAQAGIRSDLGLGPVRVASRGQCPVPWVASKLWEPEPGESGTGQLIQRAILLNRAGLTSLPPVAAARRAESFGRTLEPAAVGTAAGVVGTGMVATGEAGAAGSGVPERTPPGAAGSELLETLRRYRAEVLELKAALRHERELNRRLQALVRGDL